jgi:hypothetical protein
MVSTVGDLNPGPLGHESSALITRPWLLATNSKLLTDIAPTVSAWRSMLKNKNEPLLKKKWPTFIVLHFYNKCAEVETQWFFREFF